MTTDAGGAPMFTGIASGAEESNERTDPVTCPLVADTVAVR